MSQQCILSLLLYHNAYIISVLYLNGTFHISYNTGFPLASVRLAPRSEGIEERRLSRRAGGVVRTTAASSTFRAIAATITATGGTGSGAGSLSTAFAGTRRARRFGRLRKRRRFSRTRCAPVGRLSDRLRVRPPRICKSNYHHKYVTSSLNLVLFTQINVSDKSITQRNNYCSLLI